MNLAKSLGDIVESRKKRRKDENNSKTELGSQSSKLSAPTNPTEFAD
jgi:hypothetical protein